MTGGLSYPIRLAYLTLALLAVAGILFQVFLVGLSLLGGQPSWETHIGFGHMFGLFPILLLGLAFLGRLPRSDKWLVGLFLGVYLVQAEVFAVIRDAAPTLAALHPVLALVVFTTSVGVVWRAYVLLREPAAALGTDRAVRGPVRYPVAGGAPGEDDRPRG